MNNNSDYAGPIYFCLFVSLQGLFRPAHTTGIFYQTVSIIVKLTDRTSVFFSTQPAMQLFGRL